MNTTNEINWKEKYYSELGSHKATLSELRANLQEEALNGRYRDMLVASNVGLLQIDERIKRIDDKIAQLREGF